MELILYFICDCICDFFVRLRKFDFTSNCKRIRIVHDIGRAMTHKGIILKLYRKGYQTPDIARMTNHTQEACDRYIKAYKKIEKLSKTMKNEEIAQILGMGKSLVEEYIKILNKEE
jgi:predicted transcriptional regulator